MKLKTITILVALTAFFSTYHLLGVPLNRSGSTIEIVRLPDNVLKRIADSNAQVESLLDTAKPTIGTPYLWGGTKLSKGVDCSSYVLILFRSAGYPYHRWLSTKSLARINHKHGLRKISQKEARTGDLLVYGYKDDKKKWKGHVVVLIDKHGNLSGHKGLVLGSHGGEVAGVQYITFQGYDKGYFKTPKMKLCNILRVDSPISDSQQSPAGDVRVATPEK